MIYIIISTDELLEFIRDQPFAIIEFKATWCINCSRIAPHYQNFSAKYTNIKFGNIDIEYVGQEKLDKLDINLNLGAIPSFYLYKNGNLIDKLISGSQSRLESFIETNYFGEVSRISSVFSPGLNPKSFKMILSAVDDETNKQIKCSKCSQYGHKSKDCYLEVDKPASDKSKKEYKILCSQCNKMHPAWDLKCMRPVKEKTILSPKSEAIITKDKKQLTSAFPFDETPKILITKPPQKSLINREIITGNNSNSNLQAVRNELNSSSFKLDDNKNDKNKHVHWNLVPFVKEVKETENDIVKELLEKLAKLEGVSKKHENAYLTVKKQKELINILKDKVEQLANENNHLKRSKSADIYKDSK